MLKLLLLLMSGWVASANPISNVVVDVSKWQKNVDFRKVKKSGIVAVIQKASEGLRYRDPSFIKVRSQAHKLGLLFGAYHFARRNNPTMQADHFLKTVGYNKDVLLVLDLEKLPSGKEMTPREAEFFVKRVKEKTGRYPIIYGNSEHLAKFRGPHLNKCDLWVASWTTNKQPDLPPHRKKWKLWQYTNGKIGGYPKSIPGIGFFDRGKYNGSVQQLRKLWPTL